MSVASRNLIYTKLTPVERDVRAFPPNVHYVYNALGVFTEYTCDLHVLVHGISVNTTAVILGALGGAGASGRADLSLKQSICGLKIPRSSCLYYMGLTMANVHSDALVVDGGMGAPPRHTRHVLVQDLAVLSGGAPPHVDLL